MFKHLALCLIIAAITAFGSGCAGPAVKLGRGINNLTELARLGEIRRSTEQMAIWETPEAGYTKGMIAGVNRTLTRTAVGLFETLTFPFPTPTYDPIFLPSQPVYPDNYSPRRLADPTFEPDANVGFSGGDVLPFALGSRFKIFDY